jgi:hypothetical protein
MMVPGCGVAPQSGVAFGGSVARPCKSLRAHQTARRGQVTARYLLRQNQPPDPPQHQTAQSTATIDHPQAYQTCLCDHAPLWLPYEPQCRSLRQQSGTEGSTDPRIYRPPRHRPPDTASPRCPPRSPLRAALWGITDWPPLRLPPSDWSPPTGPTAPSPAALGAICA